MSLDGPPEVLPRIDVLVVDDQAHHRSAVVEMLADLGAMVTAAASGTEALKLVLEHDYAVILMDVHMPGMDGFETASLIRARERSRAVPIVFLTASADREVHVRGYALGAVDFLEKPVAPLILRSKVAVFAELALSAAVIRSQARALLAQERALREHASERLRLLESAVENAVDAVVITDANVRDPLVRYVNPAFTRLSGYAPVEVVGRPLRATQAGPADPLAMTRRLEAATRGDTVVFEDEARRRDGSVHPVELHVAPIRRVDGEPTHFVTILHDITERKRAERELRRLALHDGLTDLPNRTLFLDRAQQALVMARRAGTALAVLLVDLDRFKEVNDTFGHAVGDDVLRAIGPRVRGVLRESDTVARLGGDEFALVLPETDGARALQVADRLLRSLEAPHEVDAGTIDAPASIGIAVHPDHAEDAAGLLRCADIAMYAAKSRGTGVELYAVQQDTYSPARLALAAELRQAISAGDLILHYQPVARTGDGRIVGVEALVRWVHPGRGLLTPAEFIPLAERTGLIKPITEWVVAEASRESARWRASGLDIEIAVNVSTRDLVDPAFLRLVERLVVEADAPRPRLRCEITESTIMADPDRAMATLARLTEMGVRTSIDDFGTGYSSLAYLQRLAVDTVKIDRAFVGDMVRSASSAAIVRSVVDLSRAFGFSTVAEGVEDRQTWDLLGALGCSEAQGNFVSVPLPPERIEPLLRSGVFSPDPAPAPAGAA